MSNVATEDETARSLTLKSSLDDMICAMIGDEITLEADLENFLEDDEYIVTWMYSDDDGEKYIEIEDASELSYQYKLDSDNVTYLWKMKITLYPKID